MKYLKNNRGIALLSSLMLTLISLAMILMLMYTVTQGIKTSASQKRYQTALEASYGGLEFFSKDLLPQMLTAAIDDSNDFQTQLSTIVGQYPSLLNLQVQTASACLSQKLSSSTQNWSACGAQNKSSDPTSLPDMTLTLRDQTGNPGYQVYAKIIDTQEGNSNTAENNFDTAGVTGNLDGLVTPKHTPYMYDMEVQGQRKNGINPQEKSVLSVLYAF